MQEIDQRFKGTPVDFFVMSQTKRVKNVWVNSKPTRSWKYGEEMQLYALMCNLNMNSFLQQPCFVLCTPTAQVADEKTEKNRNFDR